MSWVPVPPPETIRGGEAVSGERVDEPRRAPSCGLGGVPLREVDVALVVAVVALDARVLQAVGPATRRASATARLIGDAGAPPAHLDVDEHLQGTARPARRRGEPVDLARIVGCDEEIVGAGVEGGQALEVRHGVPP